MRRIALPLLGLVATTLLVCSSTPAQEKKKEFQESYGGTIVAMGGRAGGLPTTTFTLRIKDYTTDEEANRYLAILAEGDQDDLLKAIRKNRLGRLSSMRSLGRDLIIVRKTPLPDGKTRIMAAFERWPTFAETRGGYRIEDYPFALLEIVIDEKGKGSGSFIAACKIDLKRDKKTGKYNLELENFGTYPHKVMGVRRD